jgi:hypothetical protein
MTKIEKWLYIFALNFLQFLESAGRLSEISLDQYTTARWALAGLPTKKMLLFNSVPLISKFKTMPFIPALLQGLT